MDQSCFDLSLNVIRNVEGITGRDRKKCLQPFKLRMKVIHMVLFTAIRLGLFASAADLAPTPAPHPHPTKLPIHYPTTTPHAHPSKHPIPCPTLNPTSKVLDISDDDDKFHEYGVVTPWTSVLQYVVAVNLLFCPLFMCCGFRVRALGLPVLSMNTFACCNWFILLCFPCFLDAGVHNHNVRLWGAPLWTPRLRCGN